MEQLNIETLKMIFEKVIARLPDGLLDKIVHYAKIFVLVTIIIATLSTILDLIDFDEIKERLHKEKC